MSTIVFPPTPQAPGRLRFLYQVSAQAHAVGSMALCLSASILMLSSAGLSALAECAADAGLHLRRRALLHLALAQPVAAAIYYASWYASWHASRYASWRSRHDLHGRRGRGGDSN